MISLWDYYNAISINRVPSKPKNLCEANISAEEVTKLISSQTNNKSSGNDRLTAEF